MSRWFKMPTGAGQNTDLAIIATKTGISKPVIISSFLIFCELREAGKQRAEILELAAFMLGEAENTLAAAWDAMEARGALPLHDPENQPLSAAERKRRQREKDKGAYVSRESHVTVTDTQSDSHAVSRSRETRPDQKDQRERPDQSAGVTVHAPARSVGSFSGFGVVGSVGSGFDVTPHLRDEDWAEMLHVAPGWDRNELVRKYNAHVASNPPNHPGPAFRGWLKKFAAGAGARP